MGRDFGICGLAGPCETMRLALADGWRAVVPDSRKQLWMRHRAEPIMCCPWCGESLVPERTATWPWSALVAATTDAQADGAGS